MTQHPGVHWHNLIRLRGVTQVWVAKQLGVSTKHLNQIVRGNVLPSVRHVVAFAQLMDISPPVLWFLQAEYVLQDALNEQKAG